MLTSAQTYLRQQQGVGAVRSAGADREAHYAQRIDTDTGSRPFLIDALTKLDAFRKPVFFPPYRSIFVWSGQEGTSGTTLGDVGGSYSSLDNVNFAADYAYSGTPNTDLSIAVDPTKDRWRLDGAALSLMKLDTALRNLRSVLDSVQLAVNDHGTTDAQFTQSIGQLVDALGQVVGDDEHKSQLDEADADYDRYQTSAADYILGTRISLLAELDIPGTAPVITTILERPFRKQSR